MDPSCLIQVAALVPCTFPLCSPRSALLPPNAEDMQSAVDKLKVRKPRQSHTMTLILPDRLHPIQSRNASSAKQFDCHFVCTYCSLCKGLLVACLYTVVVSHCLLRVSMCHCLSCACNRNPWKPTERSTYFYPKRFLSFMS